MSKESRRLGEKRICKLGNYCTFRCAYTTVINQSKRNEKKEREQERKTTEAASTQKAEAALRRCGWTLTSTLFLFCTLICNSCQVIINRSSSSTTTTTALLPQCCLTLSPIIARGQRRETKAKKQGRRK